jgi:hypothetical protein
MAHRLLRTSGGSAVGSGVRGSVLAIDVRKGIADKVEWRWLVWTDGLSAPGKFRFVDSHGETVALMDLLEVFDGGPVV